MAKSGKSFTPDQPATSIGTEPSPEPVPTLRLATDTGAESAATVRVPEAPGAAAAPAAAPAEAPPRKKPTPRQSELSIMQQIARRMKRLPSDQARARVAGWFAEEYAAKGGDGS
jgi:hypothetical protein